MVERLARRLGVALSPGPGPARTGSTRRAGEDVFLVCPQTFMNRSGEALAALDPGHALAPEQFLVVYDDLDLAPGDLRIRRQGSDSGHRGMRSILAWAGSEDVPRLRLGVGGPRRRETAEARDYVLEEPAAEEREAIEKAIAAAVEAVLTWLDSVPLDVVMSRFNQRTLPPPRGDDAV